MADLLFTFSGRIGRLGYLLSLICMGIVTVLIFMLQRTLGDWKFAGIFITTATMLPIIIYLTATSKRFQDRGRHPLVGFLLYFAIPAFLVFGINQILGEAFIPMNLLQEHLAGVSSIEAIPQPLMVKLAAYGLAALLFLLGQISLFLRKGTKGTNVFDESKPLEVSF